MQIPGEIGSSSTGRLRFSEIQVSTSGVSSKRPFLASMATSQTEIAETMDRPRNVAALRASGAPALIQTQACVSSTAAPICSRGCIPNFARGVDVAKNPGAVGGAPEEGRFRRPFKGNHLGSRAPIPGDHDAFLFICDVFDDREAFGFEMGDSQFHGLTIS
jgi:hypothetical protein